MRSGGGENAFPEKEPRPLEEVEGKRTASKEGALATLVRKPIWATLGALVGIVGLVISGIEIYQAMRTPPVDLEIAALTLDAEQTIQGTVTNGSDVKQAVGSTPMEITLQNKGGEPSLITEIRAEVVYFTQLGDCVGAQSGTEAIDANYQLAIPMNGVVPAEKFLSSEIRFEVRPGAADRMVMTLGPETQPAFLTNPMVVTAKIKLIHDGDQAMEAGTVSLVTTADTATAQIDALEANPSLEARLCAKKNLEHLDDMFTIQATRSRVLEGLRSAYQRASA